MSPPSPAAAAIESALLPLAELQARLERVLSSSPADATEIVWVEARRGRAASRWPRDEGPGRAVHECTVVVRVLERGRLGLHRTGAVGASELELAVRLALASARLQQPTPGWAFPAPAAAGATPPGSPVRDPELAALTAGEANDRVRRMVSQQEEALLEWSEGQVVIANSSGLRRAVVVTVAELSIACGRGPGGGRASGASRALAGLDADGVVAAARARHQEAQEAHQARSAPGARDAGQRDAASAGASEGPDWTGGRPVLLWPEATAALVAALAGTVSPRALIDAANGAGPPPPAVAFDRRLRLREDGGDERGLPFPFDLEGRSREPAILAVEGRLAAPGSLARLLAAAREAGSDLALPADPPQNLVLEAGDAGTAVLLTAAEGGIAIAALERVTLAADGTVEAGARGVRRVRNGRLEAALPDFRWTGHAGRLLAQVSAVGDRLVVRARGDGLLGGTAAPSLVLGC